MMASRDPQRPVLGPEAVVQASLCATRAACQASIIADGVEVPNSRKWTAVETDLSNRRGGDQGLASQARVMANSDRQGPAFATEATACVSLGASRAPRRSSSIPDVVKAPNPANMPPVELDLSTRAAVIKTSTHQVCGIRVHGRHGERRA